MPVLSRQRSGIAPNRTWHPTRGVLASAGPGDLFLPEGEGVSGPAMVPADPDSLYRALMSRDSRFDGRFFVGVTSTGVYCRPICRAPKPRAERCRYFPSAAAAERLGFRPCLRCRPELAPGARPHRNDSREIASVDAVRRLAHAAAGRIAAGALAERGVDDLADELGMSARHLRRAIQQEFGTTPVQLATTHRLLMAKRLLTETRLSVTRVAYASGFGSLRRFNFVFRSRYGLPPSRVRRTGGVDGHAGPPNDPDILRLQLAYRPPYAWRELLAYLRHRCVPGVEAVTAHGRYQSSIELDGHTGVVAIDGGDHNGHTPEPHLRVTVSMSLLPVLSPLLARVRGLLDLDAEPSTIDVDLSRDPALRPLVARRPGLRVPGALDPFALAVRAVLGQQVSIGTANTLGGRLVRLVGQPLTQAAGHGPAASLTHLPVSAVRLADASPALLAEVGLPRTRIASLLSLARLAASGELPELGTAGSYRHPTDVAKRLQELPGFGPWTTSYIAMRALKWPDAFPEGDLGLRRTMGGMSAARLRARSEPWRPWRAYAAQYLWFALNPAAETK